MCKTLKSNKVDVDVDVDMHGNMAKVEWNVQFSIYTRVITWPTLGKQKTQAKEVYFKHQKHITSPLTSPICVESCWDYSCLIRSMEIFLAKCGIRELKASPFKK